MGILIDTAVDNCRATHRRQILKLFGSVSQEEYLQVKAPRAHIQVEIGKVGIVFDALVSYVPAKPRAEFVGQRRLPCPYVPCDEHKILRQSVSLSGLDPASL
jgi:hypothetical protein